MQFDYRYNQTGNHHMAAAAEYSGHAFSAATERQINSLIRNSIDTIKIPLKMVAASMYLPKDDPKHPRGEDAHFIAADEQFIGVADGVGGWRMSGIDGGEYARQIMFNSVISLIPNNNNNNIHNNKCNLKSPKRVLEEAYNKTTVKGSSTACILSLSGDDKMLRAANVGDSGFFIIRDGVVFYRSPTQQRSFNCPYQLGTTKDNPSVAEEIEVRVEKGDLIVLGTDGLLDNMHESELLEIMRRRNTVAKDLAELCCYVANTALYNSFDRFTDTPFSIASRRAGKKHKGGKIDDITVIIASIE